MARPINLFQGPAPAAIGMMGQGLSEAGANIGRSLQQGYAALGEGLAGGITAAAGAFKQSQDLNAANSVTKSVLGSKELYKQLFPDSTEEQRIQQLDTFKQIGVNNGAVGQAQFTSQFLGPILQRNQMAMQLENQMKLAQLHEGAATQRTSMTLDRQREDEIAKLLFGTQKSKAADTVTPPAQGPSRMFTPGILGERIKMTIGGQ